MNYRIKPKNEGSNPDTTSFLRNLKNTIEKFAHVRSRRTTDPERLLTISEARTLRRQRVSSFIEKCYKAIDRRKVSRMLTTFQADIITKVLGSKEPNLRNISQLASNPRARTVFFNAMYCELQKLHADDDTRMYFATIVDQSWCLSKTASSFDLSLMETRVKRSLRNIGYDGIYILEIQVVTGIKGIHYMPHVHGCIWPNGKDSLKPKAVTELMNRRFKGISRAKGFTMRIMPHRLSHSLTTRFHYMTKLSDSSSGYCPVKGEDNSFKPDSGGRLKRNSPKNFPDLDALRIAGLLGQLHLEKTVFAVGEGTKIRKLASKALAARLNGYDAWDLNFGPEDVRALWAKFLPEMRDKPPVGRPKRPSEIYVVRRTKRVPIRP